MSNTNNDKYGVIHEKKKKKRWESINKTILFKNDIWEFLLTFIG